MSTDPPDNGDEGRWLHSEMETFYASDLPSRVEPCEVVLAAGELAVSHRDEELGSVTFRGGAITVGHFTVRAAHGATGTLHRLPGSDRLEGSWIDRGYRGMWTITLSADPEDAVR